MIMANPDKIFLKHYNQYKDKIFTFFLYRVNFNRAIAEDLTSEAFIKALENFDSFDENRSFQAWIYTIAGNHLKNYYRTCNREVDLEYAKDKTREFHNSLNASLELEAIMEKIHMLETYHKEVLLLRFVDGLSNTEIADVLEKDEGAVRVQVSRALGVLREKLEARKIKNENNRNKLVSD
jgi:RNA polymerase sigma-70 factor, ECF subfamily